MARFYLRKLRAELRAREGGGAGEAGSVAVLETPAAPRARRTTRRTTAANGVAASNGALLEPVITTVPAPELAPAPPSVSAESAPVADIVDDHDVEAVPLADTTVSPLPAGTDATELGSADAGEAAEVEEGEAEGEGGEAGAAPRRRRRRGRRGRGRGTTETAAAEEVGILPTEPGLPPETIEFDRAYVPEVPPSSHLSELVQRGSLVLPEQRGWRRRGGRFASPDAGRATVTPAPEPAPTTTAAPAARPGRYGSVEEQLARHYALLDLMLQEQKAMRRALERMMVTMDRRGGGGGAGGSVAAVPRTAVFIDVPNIVYAAERIGVEIDWSKVLHFLTRDRQLVRATAYAPVSDDPRQSVEMQKFVQPFVKLPVRILTKPLKRFTNGEIKANFDVELALDVLTMADRLDIVSLVSGDGDFRRMVELVQAKGVRVEVIAFSSSTAGELRAVCDDYIDMAMHLEELRVMR